MLIAILLWIASDKPILLDSWNPPVYNASQVLIQEEKLYALDAASSRVKVYRFQLESLHSKFLWQTKGKGQGPGEVQGKLSFFAVDPQKNLWLSHRNGFHIYNDNGHFQRAIKENVGSVHLVVDQESFYCTRGFGYRYPKEAVRTFNPNTTSLSKPLWTIDNLEGPAYTKEGHVYNPAPVLFSDTKHLYYVRPYTGDYIKIQKEKGIISNAGKFVVRYPEGFEPEGRMPLSNRVKGRIGVTSFPHYYPGFHLDNQGLWTVLPDFNPQNGSDFSAIVLLDKDTGSIKNRMHTPLRQMQLVLKQNHRFLLLDLELGDRMVWWEMT